jgi:ubiquinone biosynthesis protein UbiJ
MFARQTDPDGRTWVHSTTDSVACFGCAVLARRLQETNDEVTKLRHAVEHLEARIEALEAKP